MFVVRRPFRDVCGMRQAGSIVDPASVKRFRYRLQEKHIIKVTEENYDEVNAVLMKRYGRGIQEPIDTDHIIGIKVGVPSNPIIEVPKETMEKAEKLKTEQKKKVVAKGTVKK